MLAVKMRETRKRRVEHRELSTRHREWLARAPQTMASHNSTTEKQRVCSTTYPLMKCLSGKSASPGRVSLGGRIKSRGLLFLVKRGPDHRACHEFDYAGERGVEHQAPGVEARYSVH